MKISETDMKTIKIDRVHRTGEHSQWRHRPLIVRFLTNESKAVVLKYTKNIDNTVFERKRGVSEQFLLEFVKRRTQLHETSVHRSQKASPRCEMGW